MWKKYKQYIILPAIALTVGGLAGFLTRNSFDMFEEIIKTPLSPPAMLFPIVWTVLYILMGLGAALVYTKSGSVPFLYWLQLFVNFLWPVIFFNMRAYLFAFIWLILLLGLVIVLMYDFYRVSRKAALLQIPYVLWLLFAAYLNCGIWILNSF